MFAEIVGFTDLSGQVKLENIEAFMNAARKYGKWPLDPKNFE